MTNTIDLINNVRNILLNITKDMEKLSTSYENDKCTKDVIKTVRGKRKAYCEKYALSEEGMTFYYGLYQYFFTFIVEIKNEDVRKDAIAVFLSLNDMVNNFITEHKLSYDELVKVGDTVGSIYDIASKYPKDSITYKYFTGMADVMFAEIMTLDNKKER